MLKRHLLQRRSRLLFAIKCGKLLVNRILAKVRKICPKTAVELRICGRKYTSLILRPIFGGGKKSKCHEKGRFCNTLLSLVCTFLALQLVISWYVWYCFPSLFVVVVAQAKMCIAVADNHIVHVQQHIICGNLSHYLLCKWDALRLVLHYHPRLSVLVEQDGVAPEVFPSYGQLHLVGH